MVVLLVVIVVVFSSSSIVACKKRFRMCDALSVSNSRPKEGPILECVWVLRFDKKSERGRRSKMRNQSKECEDRNRSSLLSSVAQTFDSPDTCCVTTTTTMMMMMMIRR